MKILLINPPFHCFIGLEQDYVPLSLLAVGSKLTADGHEVFLKNLELNPFSEPQNYQERISSYEKLIDPIKRRSHPVWNVLRKTIEEVKPDKIGITVTSAKYRLALRVAEIAKEFGIPVMVGGPHPTVCFDRYEPGVKVIRGEFEADSRGRVKELDSLPYPNYDQLLDRYSPDGYGHVISSRGCCYNCSFCASSTIWNGKVTFKSIDRFLNELRIIDNRFKPNYFTIWDETFLLQKKRVAEFCRKYALAPSWRCDARADELDLETVKMMRDSGCTQISIGVESGVDDILQKINKKTGIRQIQQAANILNQTNTFWRAYCIIGLPDEREEDILTTLSFVKSLNPSLITLSIFTPYPGTRLYQQCVDEDLLGSEYDELLFSHQSPRNHFTKHISPKRFKKLRDYVVKAVDSHNEENMSFWDSKRIPLVS